MPSTRIRVDHISNILISVVSILTEDCSVIGVTDEKRILRQSITREHEFRGPDSTNHQGKLFERKGISKRCLGGAHRVHFEHSLLHDSVTTIRVAPG